MLGHGLVRADSENIVTNYRLFQRVNVTREFHRVNIQVQYYDLFLFTNNSFIKKNNNKEVRGAIIQYATMCCIWHFNFSIDSLHLGYIVLVPKRVLHVYVQKLRFFKSLFSQEIKKEINYNTRISFEFVMAEFFLLRAFLFV